MEVLTVDVVPLLSINRYKSPSSSAIRNLSTSWFETFSSEGIRQAEENMSKSGVVIARTKADVDDLFSPRYMTLLFVLLLNVLVAFFVAVVLFLLLLFSWSSIVPAGSFKYAIVSSPTTTQPPMGEDKASSFFEPISTSRCSNGPGSKSLSRKFTR